jgi:hypothetical protein
MQYSAEMERTSSAKVSQLGKESIAWLCRYCGRARRRVARDLV